MNLVISHLAHLILEEDPVGEHGTTTAPTDVAREAYINALELLCAHSGWVSKYIIDHYPLLCKDADIFAATYVPSSTNNNNNKID